MEKKLAFVFGFLAFGVLFAFLILLAVAEQHLKVSSDSVTLVASLKGSIYESGESISLFGTCLSADGVPLSNASAVLSAYYPNGSVMFTNVSMSEINTGYFLYTSPMSAVRGTYFTVLNCSWMGYWALAFGEWQNPFWVARLANLSNVNLSNVTDAIADLKDFTNSSFINLTQYLNLSFGIINQSFNITWTKLEQINTTVVQESNKTQEMIISLNSTMHHFWNYTANYTNITWSEEHTKPKYMTDWTLWITAYEDGRQVTDVTCYVNTSLPSYGNAVLVVCPTYSEDDAHCNTFKYQATVTVHGVLYWDIYCYR